jgi:hypothetical protein
MLANQNRRLILIREEIAKQPFPIQQKIAEAEKVIDEALLNPKGWFNIDVGLQVFPDDKKIDEVTKRLIQNLYTIGGYSVYWRNGSNVIVMSN